MSRDLTSLNECTNSGCAKCDRGERAQNTEDHLCSITISEIDGLPVRCVGRWAYDKIYRLAKYFGIFANGMKNKWRGINYVEICSGPGRCIFREEGTEVDGTAMAIANHPAFQHVDQARFIDLNEAVVDTLNTRISNAGKSNRARAVIADFNDESGLRSAIAGLATDHLNLVFVDPTECDVPLTCLLTVAECLNNVDFIINVAYGTDAKRNLVRAFTDDGFAKAKEKYTAFLGSSAFFDDPENHARAEANDISGLIDSFRDHYRKKLSEHDFNFFDEKRVKHYYSLMFVSRSDKGLEFWNKANRIEPNGQRTFDL